MIKSIYMKKCATYTDEGALIDNCQKINFFYGPNGSGKSTISKFLFDPTLSDYSSCIINWENNISTDIIVYNRDFRNNHFKNDIEGIFTLGKATIDDIKALEELKIERTKKNDNYVRSKGSLINKKREEQEFKDKFRDSVWNEILKKNETVFQEAFIGFRANKEKFRDEVINRYNKPHFSDDTKEALINRSKTLFSKKPEKYNTFDISSIEEIAEDIETIEKDGIWSKIIIGNKDVPISKLIDFLDNADWVNKGRVYIKDSEICPFCQQKTITKEFEQQLNLFFNGEYQKDVDYIKELVAHYKIAYEKIVASFNSYVERNAQLEVANFDEQKFNAILDSLNSLFVNMLTEMSSKKNETGKKLVLEGSRKKIDELINIIKTANDNIIKHNQIVDNYIEEKEKLVDSVWNYLMNEQNALISGYIKGLAGIEKAKCNIEDSINRCKKDIEELNDKIIKAGENITDVQPTVDEINRLLIAYGFTNFKIVPSPSKKNYYQIQRPDGTLASDTLSEGEETFISFLYFLQFAKGSIDKDKVSTKKILVLDDPICSLDSTVLYIVSSMVKSLIKDIREGKSDVEQLFILTHNVFFHKEASFIDGRTKEVNDIHYWIISKDINISKIKGFERVNPIKTSYELLWQELKTNTNASLITTQNIMRRILENYFGILGQSIDDTIVSSFETPEEQIICRSLISWINDGSHSIPDDFYIDSYTDSIERYRLVFKEIFNKMEHKAHYDMMMA